MKVCSRCGEAKDESEYHLSSRYGRQYWCKDCRRGYDRADHVARRELRLEQKRVRRLEDRAW